MNTNGQVGTLVRISQKQRLYMYILMSSLLGSQILKCHPELGSGSYNCRL